ncbi:uncharacterized protein B0H18DRAFT_1009330 [Fomitopsis serialis]|uniref:uncharacterized protein n=1 Tax=Fomitopsis serialis TaxID=139415 RepID=UPI0020086209|nr:uncharacterized protein B0H18DRAFT_1009330 [Neoantrodia serialis]KAH9925263.1 hypothetical protein B0H18DRAFT_1009330 [Neoantrodia serialis]
MSKFTPTPAEVALVNQIFTQADTQKLGVITGDAAVKIFNGSKLTPSVLAEIWNLADEDNNGVLTRKGVAVAVRLLGHAQRGEKMTEALVLKPGPAPTIEGLSPPLVQQSTGVPAARSPPPGLPPLTPQDKTKFMKLFLSCGPVNGILNGDKARDVFVKSKLPVDKLSQIWNLADTKNRGSLDVTDFTIAMYLIQATMHGQLQTIPPVLPPGLYEQAAGKSPFDGVATHATGSSGHYSPGLSAAFPGRPMSMMEPNFTGQASTLQPQMTGPMRSAVGAQPQRSALSSTPAFPFVQPQATGAQWDVTPAEKANADRIFDTLDTQKRGYIEGDVAVPFMLLSKLQEDVLAQVWDLADLSNDGHLTRDGFAVAMHLIQGKLNGRDIPAAIPPGLIPPSMRGALGAPPAPAVQPQQTVPDAMRDLLWDDSPPASATVQQPQPFTLQPQSTGAFTTPVLHPQSTGARQNPMTPPPQRAATVPSVTDPFASANSPFAVPAPAQSAHRDLLGDDDEPAQAASPPLQDRSAEIGNVKNQLSSTNRSLETAKTERESMERTLSEQAAQLSALQTQLSSAKAAYETETRLLGALRERYSKQTTDIQKTREELIRAESDLSAVRVEKAEVEGAVLRDKEEVRDLQRRMTEVGMEVETLKVDVEKAKKEAKQQKGLLAIAKKQLATRETERARVQKELGETQSEAAEATREREQAEAELEKEVPAAMTNGHGGVASPDILAMAAAQPLPATPEVPTSPTGSVLSLGKSNNPFERVAMASGTGSRAQSPSPFLPFTNTGNLPTPPTTVTESPVQQSTPVSAAANPFRFSQAFSPVEGGSLLAAADAPGASDGLSDLMSPTDTDMFHTPLSSATGVAPAPTPSIEATLTEALSEPAAAPTEPTATTSIFDEPGAIQATTAEATQEPADIREETDLSHQLKELDVEESDSDSESEEEPLANVKARLSGEAPHTDGITESSTSQTISAFDDSFGISAPTQDARPGSSMRSATGTPVRSLTPAVASAAPTNAFDETFAIPAVAQPSEPFAAPVPIPTTAAPQTNGDDPGTPGVNDFDEAMGKLGASTSSNGGPSQFSEFSFDSAFDDNFDFAAASAATSQPAAPNGNGHAAPAAAPADNAFDNVFMSQPSSAFPPVGAPPAQAPAITGSPFRQPATQETRPFSFDDAFSAGPSALPAQSGSNGSVVNAISFDDAFGGQSSALALDTSFGTTTSEASAAPSQVKGPTPFPTASPPQSPTGPTSPGFGRRRSTSPPRHLSPPPRHSSPKPNARPSTAGSEKEKAPNTRHSKLSIRLPFGRKKKTAPHEIPPLPSSSLATQQVLEEPTPAVEDDIDAVKQLCGMGFSRTQAVMALENHGYDVQRALNSLLGS